MPIPPILTPLPNSKYRELHDEREALARLKLHLLMARLRTGLRRMIAVEENRKLFSQFLQYIKDEVSFVLLHIGYIHLQGFRIAIPYQLQDLADLLYNPMGDVFGCDLAFHKDLDQDFNAISDQLILQTTRDYFYWWKPNFKIPSDGGHPHAEIIGPHFTEYYNAVVNEKYESLSQGMPYEIAFLDTKEDVPGLAPRPIRGNASAGKVGLSGDNATTPTGLATGGQPPSADKPRSVGPTATCDNCVETRRLVLAALKKLRSAQANIAMHIREGEEAAFRSCDMINGYTALENIADVCEPFADGKGLPKQFRKVHPKHEKQDEHQGYFDFNLLRASRDPFLVTLKEEAKDDTGPATVNKVSYRFLCFKEMPIHATFVDPGDENAGREEATEVTSDLDDTVLDIRPGGGGSDDGQSVTTSIPSEFEHLVDDEDNHEEEQRGDDDADDEDYQPDLDENEFVDEGFVID